MEEADQGTLTLEPSRATPEVAAPPEVPTLPGIDVVEMAPHSRLGDTIIQTLAPCSHTLAAASVAAPLGAERDWTFASAVPRSLSQRASKRVLVGLDIKNFLFMDSGAEISISKTKDYLQNGQVKRSLDSAMTITGIGNGDAMDVQGSGKGVLGMQFAHAPSALTNILSLSQLRDRVVNHR
jgi:hypothetical protein